MLRTTPLLIVMMLLGNSGVALVCELWCFSRAGEEHHGADRCHEASIPDSPDRQLAATTGCSSPLLAAFINEARPTNTRPMPVTLPSGRSISQGEDRAVGTEDWRVFNVRPPRPQASRTILRI